MFRKKPLVKKRVPKPTEPPESIRPQLGAIQALANSRELLRRGLFPGALAGDVRGCSDFLQNLQELEQQRLEEHPDYKAWQEQS